MAHPRRWKKSPVDLSSEPTSLTPIFTCFPTAVGYIIHFNWISVKSSAWGWVCCPGWCSSVLQSLPVSHGAVCHYYNSKLNQQKSLAVLMTGDGKGYLGNVDHRESLVMPSLFLLGLFLSSPKEDILSQQLTLSHCSSKIPYSSKGGAQSIDQNYLVFFFFFFLSVFGFSLIVIFLAK